MSRTLRTAAALLVLAAAPVVAGAAGAAGAATHPQHFTIYSANVNDKDVPELVQARGPISGIGTVKVDDDVAGGTVPFTLVLPRGKVFVSSRSDFEWQPDLKTCTATVRNQGTFTIAGGTGAYRKATGSGTFVERGFGIGVRGPSGVCLRRFKLNYVVATATGTVAVA